MTYAAIYIKPDKPKASVLDSVKATTIQGQLKQAFNTAKNNIKNFDVKSFANNLTLEGATDFTQKYATAGLTKIINGEPITNQSMMDGLFNGYAPAMDMTAVQMGYNSVREMQVAVKNGNINVANFMQGSKILPPSFKSVEAYILFGIMKLHNIRTVIMHIICLVIF